MSSPPEKFTDSDENTEDDLGRKAMESGHLPVSLKFDLLSELHHLMPFTKLTLPPFSLLFVHRAVTFQFRLGHL